MRSPLQPSLVRPQHFLTAGTGALLLAGCAGMATTGNEAMEAKIEADVRALHEFFQEWFRGSLPQDDAGFARFPDTLADDFEIVSPNGLPSSRGQVIDRVRAAHGQDPQARIWIENARVRAAGQGVWICTYEEWQGEGANARGRLSTAVMREDAERPMGLAWLHVAEVWLPGGR